MITRGAGVSGLGQINHDDAGLVHTCDAPAAATAAAAPPAATLKRQASKTQALPKTIPAGPAMWDFVPLWLRKEVDRKNPYTYALEGKMWTNMADSMVIALPAVRERYCGGGQVTNRAVLKEVRRKLQRYILPAKRESSTRCPSPSTCTSSPLITRSGVRLGERGLTGALMPECTLRPHADAAGVLDKELAALYMEHPGTRVELPDDDAPFVWAPGLQLACDFDVSEVNAALLDTKEPAVSTTRGVAWGVSSACSAAAAAPRPSQLSIADEESVAAPPPPHQKLTLSNCLERSAQREQLSEHDMWYCRSAPSTSR